VSVGGRAILFAALAGCAPPPPPAVVALGEPRATLRVLVPLVPADRQGLVCASGARLGPLRCGHVQPGTPWPVERVRPDDQVLQPYTPMGEDAPKLIVAAMLWDDPEVAELAAERVGRFVVSCELAVFGQAHDLLAQWEPGGQWFPSTTYGSEPPPVGLLRDCRPPRGPRGR
jgi:hypothetical protein